MAANLQRWPCSSPASWYACMPLWSAPYSPSDLALCNRESGAETMPLPPWSLGTVVLGQPSHHVRSLTTPSTVLRRRPACHMQLFQLLQPRDWAWEWNSRTCVQPSQPFVACLQPCSWIHGKLDWPAQSNQLRTTRDISYFRKPLGLGIVYYITIENGNI